MTDPTHPTVQSVLGLAQWYANGGRTQGLGEDDDPTMAIVHALQKLRDAVMARRDETRDVVRNQYKYQRTDGVFQHGQEIALTWVLGDPRADEKEEAGG